MRTPRPINLRVSDIQKWYGVTEKQAKTVVKVLTPCGVWGSDPLFSRKDVERRIEEINERLG
ncbi:hypothetical protein [Corynebacterium sp. NML120713]|uniref:hypothetical protein n=1 Tax=Corynebacterium sp. NML120713 TaxID=1906332 RepID=UPI0011604DF0|nr:hypothetical protein [Corynebacterium sp. NML120713]